MAVAGSVPRCGEEPVPFLDLGVIHRGLKRDILEDVAALIDSGDFVNGDAVAHLEHAFAGYCHTTDCVGVANGLDALRIGLLASGVERGDEVIVPANTFVATVEAVAQAGAAPVLVDVSEHDYNIDPGAVEAAITPRTRFLLPVHLYGLMADVRALLGISARSGLPLIEDACQAHGADRDGFRAGSIGSFAGFSFYPGKNLGAMGDAGALTTSSSAIAERARALREHGQRTKYHHDEVGFTSRLDTIQALILLRKLPLLDVWTAERRKAASSYMAALRGIGDIELPPVPAGSNPVWHLFPVRTRRAQDLAVHLQELGISTGRHYPVPVHLTGAFTSLGYPRGTFPVAEALAEELVSLPMFPGLREDQLDRIVGAVRSFFDG